MADTKKQDKIDEFIQSTLNSKKMDKMDLSSDEDLSIAIMNLISIEEHFFFTANKTGDNKYYELLMQIREIRKSMLKRIIKTYEGEVWCISKHLLAASMRLMEYGTKLQSQSKFEDAHSVFQKSYELYTLFWGLNLNVIQSSDVKTATTFQESLKDVKVADEVPNNVTVKDATKKIETNSSGFMNKLSELVRKTIDCCIE